MQSSQYFHLYVNCKIIDKIFYIVLILFCFFLQSQRISVSDKSILMNNLVLLISVRIMMIKRSMSFVFVTVIMDIS